MLPQNRNRSVGGVTSTSSRICTDVSHKGSQVGKICCPAVIGGVNNIEPAIITAVFVFKATGLHPCFHFFLISGSRFYEGTSISRCRRHGGCPRAQVAGTLNYLIFTFKPASMICSSARAPDDLNSSIGPRLFSHLCVFINIWSAGTSPA